MPLHPSMKDGGGEERRMESWRFIPAAAQDPIQTKPGGIRNCFKTSVNEWFWRPANCVGSLLWWCYVQVSCRASTPERAHSSAHQLEGNVGEKCEEICLSQHLDFFFFQHCKMFRILQHANWDFFSFFSLQLWNESRNRNGFFSSRYHLYCQCLVTLMPECSCLQMVFLQYTEGLRASAGDFCCSCLVEITSLCCSPYKREKGGEKE